MRRVEELRRMSDDQLKNRLNEIAISLRRAVGKVKAGGAIGKDTMYIRRLKKEKARILTILRERELKRNERRS
jgi:ribosomal protein L29